MLLPPASPLVQTIRSISNMCEHFWHEQANVDNIWSDFPIIVQSSGAYVWCALFPSCVGTIKNEDIIVKMTEGMMSAENSSGKTTQTKIS